MVNCLDDCVQRFRYLIVFVLFSLGVAAIIIASQIGPLTEEQGMLPTDHELIEVQNLLADSFMQTATQE